MKYNGLLKKLAAGATTVAMLASLGVSAFAYDYNVTGGITIDSVSATYTENNGVKNYTITVQYSGVTAEDQVSVLGYVFDDATNTTTDLDAANITDTSIYAVNQEAGTGTTTIYLSTDANGNGEKDGKDVAGTENLIIKMGTDNATYSAAQAVSIDLDSATKNEEPFVASALKEPVTVSVSYGSDATVLEGVLPEQVTLTGKRGTEDAELAVDVTWTISDGWVASSLSGYTINGTLDTTAIDSTSTIDTNVTATVTVTALTDGTVADYTTKVEIKKDATSDEVKAAVASAVKTVTVTSGLVSDTYEITAANVTANVVTDTIGNTGTATITLNGTSAQGIFNLTNKTITVTSLEVVEAPAGPTGMYGNISNDFDTGEVNDFDWMALLNHVTGRVEIEEIKDKTSGAFKAANVSNDFDTDEVNDFDWMALLNHVTGRVINPTIGTEF